MSFAHRYSPNVPGSVDHDESRYLAGAQTGEIHDPVPQILVADRQIPARLVEAGVVVFQQELGRGAGRRRPLRRRQVFETNWQCRAPQHQQIPLRCIADWQNSGLSEPSPLRWRLLPVHPPSMPPILSEAAVPGAGLYCSMRRIARRAGRRRKRVNDATR